MELSVQQARNNVPFGQVEGAWIICILRGRCGETSLVNGKGVFWTFMELEKLKIRLVDIVCSTC